MNSFQKFLIFLMTLVLLVAVYLTWRDGFKPGLWLILGGLFFAYMAQHEINKSK